jgi:hypothetical protein
LEEGRILPFCAVSEKANLVNYLLPLALAHARSHAYTKASGNQESPLSRYSRRGGKFIPAARLNVNPDADNLKVNKRASARFTHSLRLPLADLDKKKDSAK